MIPHTDTFAASEKKGQQCVEIRLWEIYFPHSRKNLLNTLSAYSLEGKPLNHDPGCGIFSFRFLKYDWDKNIKPLLTLHSIQFEIVRIFDTDVLNYNSKKKLYLVEDDLETLFALNISLGDAGYDVLLSHCARPLMENTLPPTDLFILDKSMPDGDGLEICARLRKRSETRNTPVIMISAFRNAQADALAAGVDDFLEKPFAIRDLLSLVSKHTSTTASSLRDAVR